MPEYKLSEKDYIKLTERYKGGLNTIINILKEHPYQVLIGVLNHDFKSVNELVQQLIPEPYPYPIEKCEYMIMSVLEKYSLTGHTCIPTIELGEIIVKEFPDMIDFVKETIDKSEVLYYNKKEEWIANLSDYLIEQKWANYLQNLLSVTSCVRYNNVDYERYGEYDLIKLTHEQLHILQLAGEYGCCLLTGAAGTGKSESINALVRMLDDLHYSYTLLAPTGIAAKRLSEASGREAYTIHKYCIDFQLITTDYVIIDESSMLSLEHINLLLLLLSANEPLTKLIMIGDMAQLAAIGKGNIMYDMVQSKIIPHAHLSTVFRYGQNSIYTVATDIRNHYNYFASADLSDKHYEFISLENDFDKQLKEVYKSLLETYKKQDILILSPYNKRTYGSKVINTLIQSSFNVNQAENFYGRDFRVGDLVINTKNSYNKHGDSVFNGDRGIIRSFHYNKDLKELQMNVQFDNFIYTYDSTNESHIQLSYCISTHKSQGTQAKAVILITAPEHSHLLTSNLLYTAITRAQEKVIHIGTQWVIEKAINKQETKNKHTCLQSLLKEIGV